VIDIALIREKPEWVKQQLINLQDEPAVARIDQMLALDIRRRALMHEAETLQAERNKLNKAMGPFRGSKTLSNAAKARAAADAVRAIQAADFAHALELLSTLLPTVSMTAIRTML
jgi:seryl-tRNA synthetase